MISVDRACQQILAKVASPVGELLPIGQVTGRVLREEVYAERDAPPFDRVMMDGYAIQFSDPLPDEFRVIGIALAGHLPPVMNDNDCCIEVTTGCPLPPGCDSIIPVEDCLCNETIMQIRDDAVIKPGQYIHSRGSDGLAGRIVLNEGIRLGPPELAILATEGRMNVSVGKIPRIGLVTTGDEIVLDGKELLPSQIRGSHFEALRALFHALPGIELTREHARDDEDDLLNKLKTALADSDILLITGGVSRGRKDLVPGLLKKLGVEEVLHRVTQRPGKPLWFGVKGNKLVFGLPGNPISTLICARRYVVPVIEKWMGSEHRAPMQISLSRTVDTLTGFTRFVPVRISQNKAAANPFSTSGSLHDLVGTDGFIEVPPSGTTVQTFKYFPWSS